MSFHSEKMSDIQADDARIKLGLRRVGVTDIPKIIRRKWKGQYNELSAKIDVFVDLIPSQRGIHMSRNIEVINEVTSEVTSSLMGELISNTEELCAKIAKKVLLAQPGAKYSEVRLKADYETETFSEALWKKKLSVHTLRAGANAERTEKGINIVKIIGAEVEGTTVCPCSQELSKDYAKEQLKKKEFSDEQIKTIVDCIPMASHNQRSKAILLLELPESAKRVELDDIIKILEISMSAPLHEVLKRKDEQAVVLYAHSRPSFVEDVVRTILYNVAFKFDYLPSETGIYVKQTNFESIHRHNAVAEIRTTLEILKEQLAEKKGK